MPATPYGWPAGVAHPARPRALHRWRTAASHRTRYEQRHRASLLHRNVQATIGIPAACISVGDQYDLFAGNSRATLPRMYMISAISSARRLSVNRTNHSPIRGDKPVSVMAMRRPSAPASNAARVVARSRAMLASLCVLLFKMADSAMPFFSGASYRGSMLKRQSNSQLGSLRLGTSVDARTFCG